MGVLVLHLPDSEAEPARWSLFETEAIAAFGTIRPGETPRLPDGRSAGRAVALLPSGAVFVRRIAVPGAAERDARRAAPFLIEEQLAQPLEDAVVEIGPKGADGRRLVFAASKTDVDLWRRFVAGLAIKPVHAVPAAMVLPGHGADLQAAMIGGQIVFQTREGDLNADPDPKAEPEAERDPDAAAKEPLCGAVEPELADLALPALAARLKPRRIIAGEGVDPDLLAVHGVPAALKRVPAPDPGRSAADLAVERLSVLPPLLGTGWTSGMDWAETLQPWRLAAGLAVAACLGAAALAAGQAMYLESRAEAYRDAEIAAFGDAFPEITRVVNPQAQLRQQLGAVGAGDGSGAFLELAAALSEIAAQTDSVQIDAIRYDAARGGLSVSARYAAFGDFEALRDAAEARGVTLEDGGARQAEQGVVGDFIVRLP